MSLVAVVGSRKGFYSKSLNLKKLLLLNNRGNNNTVTERNSSPYRTLHRTRSFGKL